MNEYEQQVIDALANRDHIVIYEQPGIIKRSGRLTAEEGANLTLREKNLYLGPDANGLERKFDNYSDFINNKVIETQEENNNGQ